MFKRLIRKASTCLPILLCAALVMGDLSGVTRAQAQPQAQPQSPIIAGASEDKWPVTATVTQEKGGPVLRINGEKQLPIFLYGYTGNMARPKLEDLYSTVSKSQSINRHMYVTYNHLQDFATNIETTNRVLQNDPDAHFIFRIDLGGNHTNFAGYNNLPADFPDDEWAISHNGLSNKDVYNGWPSVTSPTWRTHMRGLVDQYMDWLKEQSYADRVIGFQIMFMESGEWVQANVGERAYDDYSPYMVKAFQDWLEAEYGNEASLQEAWKDEEVTFATAEIPTKAERDFTGDGYFFDTVHNSAQALDYKLFYQDVVAEALIYSARLFKEKTNYQALVGAMYGYTYIYSQWLTPSNTGAFAVDKVMASPYIDMISTPVDYDDRHPGSGASYNHSVDTIMANGKLFIEEIDHRSHLSASDAGFGRTNTLDETITSLRNYYVRALVRGHGFYWMDLTAQGWFNDDALWQDMETLVSAYASVNLNRDDNAYSPQVALIIDEDNHAYKETSGNTTYFGIVQQKYQLRSLGISYGLYLQKDLDKIPSSVKVYLFPASWHVDASKKAQLDALKKDGNVLIFVRAPGYINETSQSAENISELIGMTVKKTAMTEVTTDIVNPTDPVVMDNLYFNSHGVSSFGAGRFGLKPAEFFTPSFYVDDPAAATIGTYSGSTYASFARKDMGDWTSIFSGSFLIPGAYLKNIIENIAGLPAYAVDGKISPYLDLVGNATQPNDTIASYETVVAYTGGSRGNKRVSLPFASHVVDTHNRKTIGSDLFSFEFFSEMLQNHLFTVIPGKVEDTPASDQEVVLNGAWVNTGDSLLSATPNDSLTFAFDGKFVSVIADGGPDRGWLGVEIDGLTYPHIDLYEAQNEIGNEYVLAQELPEGSHTVRLTVLNRKDQRSSGYGASVRAIRTLAPPELPEEADKIFPDTRALGNDATGAQFQASDTDEELGMTFKPTFSSTVTDVRMYAPADTDAVHRVSIWEHASGALVSGPYNWELVTEDAGWQTFKLPAPLSVTSGKTYTVSVSAPEGYMAGGPIDEPVNPYISGLQAVRGDAGQRPTVNENTNFFRDVVLRIPNELSMMYDQIPVTLDAADSIPLNLGTAFSSDLNGAVTKVKIYVGKNEGGTHAVRFWDAETGHLLAGPYAWELTPDPVRDDRLWAISGGAFAGGYGSDGSGNTMPGNSPFLVNNTLSYLRDVVMEYDDGGQIEEVSMYEDIDATKITFGADEPLFYGSIFEPKVDGKITKIRMYGEEMDAGRRHVKIFDYNSKNVLYSGQWDIPSGTMGWKEFTLDTPLNVTANTKYVVSVPSGTAGRRATMTVAPGGTNAQGWKEFHLPVSFPVVANKRYVVSVDTSSDHYFSSTPGSLAGGRKIGPLNLEEGRFSGALGVMPSLGGGLGNNYFRDIVFDTTLQSSLLTELPEEVARDEMQLELGIKFRTDEDGFITAVRLFTSTEEGGDHMVRLWNAETNELMAGPFVWDVERGVSGWREFQLPVPVPVESGVEYTASVSSSADYYYSITRGAFANGEISYGGVTAIRNVLSTTLGAQPTGFTDINFFRDVVFKSVGSDAHRALSHYQRTGNVYAAVEDGGILAHSAFYDKNPDHATPVQVPLDMKNNKFLTVRDDKHSLQYNRDFTVGDEGVTMTEAYLNTLDVGANKLYFVYKYGPSAAFDLTISDTRPIPPTTLPTDRPTSPVETTRPVETIRPIETAKPTEPTEPGPAQHMPADSVNNWAKEAIAKLAAAGALVLDAEGNFKPNQIATRAEFVDMLVKTLGLPAGKQTASFADTEGHWAESTIATATKLGFIKGYNAESFGPENVINRESMAVVLGRVLDLRLDAALDQGIRFTDENKISSWALVFVKATSGLGLVKGYPDGTFQGKRALSRAEAVTIIDRLETYLTKR
ncbi:DUF4082 domain-containing protein [Paenibacillus sp. PAMC21692]|uniref:DUF4082 domain-containing protein n=1 Tax=Paenibacillus sp. PAMC21692 TaxID=2762320 RepID=UPI00164E74D8|nr:DUF4082 domain-containing protein [Paenibacillus sp. PAMC21692]QNK57953.1 DUF4082 domain-containing protein [Paenibacillus sp. PAMC21692]